MGANVLVFHLLERLMSQVAGSGPLEELVGPILVIGAAIVLRELLEMLADPLAVYFGGKGISALTEALNEKAARLEVIEFDTLEAHERLELAKQGAEAAVSMLLFFLFPVYQLTFFVMAAGYLFSLSPLLELVTPLMFAPRIASHLIHGSRYYQLERKTVPLLREFQYLERCLVDREYFKETRVLGAGTHLLTRYRNASGRFNAARWREDVRLGVIDLGLNVLVLLGYGGSFLLAALLLADGSVSVGGFAVVIYAVSRLMLMTRAVMSMLGTSYRAGATASHLLELLQLDEGRPLGDGAAGASAGNLTAREVTFTYPGSERDAVSGVDLAVDQGTTLALVGANGAGKTTLAKLLLGLYVPSAGQVTRRGVDTRDASKNEVRANTSAVFQNYQRYQMSLRENVILADVSRADDEPRLAAALAQGGVPAELWQGPDGLDVMLSREVGTHDLSLGQWQRLAIARGLFRQHDTILLDEPTASIDPLEEQAVYERFMKIAAGRTAIIVTHRLASARLADRILVLEGGRIVEDGTHEELLRSRGLYHRMFTAQAAWYERSWRPHPGVEREGSGGPELGAAVDAEDLPGDVGGAAADQEFHGAGHLERPAITGQGSILHFAGFVRYPAGQKPRGDDLARRNRVHVHVVGTQLGRQAARVLVHRRLGHTVDHLTRMSVQAGDAADVHDPPGVALHHLRCHLAARQQAGHHVAIHHGANVSQRDANGVVRRRFAGVRSHGALGADVATGVVDQNVDRPETRTDLVVQLFDRRFVGEVAVHREHLPLGLCRHFGGDCLEGVGLTEGAGRRRSGAVNRDPCAQAGQVAGNDPPDPAGRARDPGHLAGQPPGSAPITHRLVSRGR